STSAASAAERSGASCSATRSMSASAAAATALAPSTARRYATSSGERLTSSIERRSAKASERALDRGRDRQHLTLRERTPDDLHADRQTFRSGARRDGDRREPGQVHPVGAPDGVDVVHVRAVDVV